MDQSPLDKSIVAKLEKKSYETRECFTRLDSVKIQIDHAHIPAQCFFKTCFTIILALRNLQFNYFWILNSSLVV